MIKNPLCFGTGLFHSKYEACMGTCMENFMIPSSNSEIYKTHKSYPFLFLCEWSFFFPGVLWTVGLPIECIEKVEETSYSGETVRIQEYYCLIDWLITAGDLGTGLVWEKASPGVREWIERRCIVTLLKHKCIHLEAFKGTWFVF
jgi:hypothetical protein